MLQSHLTNASFLRLFEEYGLGKDLDAAKGYSLTTPRLQGLMLKHLRSNPDSRDTEGNLISEGMVREAARCGRDVESGYDFSFDSASYIENADITAFRNSLTVDGWTVENKTLVPVAPVPLESARSRLKKNLEQPGFNEARSRLDQFEAALDGGNWEAANGIGRGFLAALFVAICQSFENGASPREESAARKHLVDHGFFGSSREAGKTSPEGEFVFKMSGMMGTEGVHAGETTPETATYRYALALLTADYYLSRLLKPSN